MTKITDGMVKEFRKLTKEMYARAVPDAELPILINWSDDDIREMLEIHEKYPTTTIRVDRKIRDRLAVLGKKTDSYNDIIERLLEKREPGV